MGCKTKTAPRRWIAYHDFYRARKVPHADQRNSQENEIGARVLDIGISHGLTEGRREGSGGFRLLSE